MTTSRGMGFLVALLLVALALVLAKLVMRPHRYHLSYACRFLCPRFRTPVDCELIQDLRTGLWKDLRNCSLGYCECALCDWDCVTHVNLGLPLAGWQQSPAGGILGPPLGLPRPGDRIELRRPSSPTLDGVSLPGGNHHTLCG
jgi:hypothetical protein